MSFEQMPTFGTPKEESKEEVKTEEKLERGAFQRVDKNGIVNFYDTEKDMIEAVEAENDRDNQ